MHRKALNSCCFFLLQTICGHRFCRVCIAKIVTNDAVAIQYFRCPLDKRVLSKQDDIWPDVATQRQIHNLKVQT